MIEVNGDTQILGLIGSDISQSKSFQLHNIACQQLDINAVYIPFSIAKENFTASMRLLSSINCFGANVTLPFKQMIIPFISQLTEDAIKIGAVNTIKNNDGKWIGHNTDAQGFINAMKEMNVIWNDRPIYLWGAGGAARAICFALQKIGIPSIYCWNRTETKVETLADIIDIQAYEVSQTLPDNAILINCTPLEAISKYPYQNNFTPYQTVIDLIYRETPLLEKARQHGAETINGFGMLLHQAAIAFQFWYPDTEPLSIMKQNIQERHQ